MSERELNNDPGQKQEGPMILAHEAVEGYRPIFYICITIGILYLAFVLWRTW
jgi:hypothetical protein